MDTHTAVAYAVYKDYKKHTGDQVAAVIAATASPYKFTGSVMSALNADYEMQSDFDLLKEMEKLLNEEMPKGIKDIESLPIRHQRVCTIDEMKKIVSNFFK